MTEQEKKLTSEEFAAAMHLVATLQAACLHKRIDEWPIMVGGKRGYMHQCRDCAMFNPPS